MASRCPISVAIRSAREGPPRVSPPLRRRQRPINLPHAWNLSALCLRLHGPTPASGGSSRPATGITRGSWPPSPVCAPFWRLSAHARGRRTGLALGRLPTGGSRRARRVRVGLPRFAEHHSGLRKLSRSLPAAETYPASGPLLVLLQTAIAMELLAELAWRAGGTVNTVSPKLSPNTTVKSCDWPSSAERRFSLRSAVAISDRRAFSFASNTARAASSRPGADSEPSRSSIPDIRMVTLRRPLYGLRPLPVLEHVVRVEVVGVREQLLRRSRLTLRAVLPESPLIR